MNTAFFFVGLPLLAVYLLPTFIAYGREHKNKLPILFLNLFLGWTFLGWVVSLVWSLTYQGERA